MRRCLGFLTGILVLSGMVSVQSDDMWPLAFDGQDSSGWEIAQGPPDAFRIADEGIRAVADKVGRPDLRSSPKQDQILPVEHTFRVRKGQQPVLNADCLSALHIAAVTRNRPVYVEKVNTVQMFGMTGHRWVYPCGAHIFMCTIC
ncbi:MAG TPA: hypothetical protein PLQ35_05875 [bacterium]|nr:hypothetical protein [bacterium]HQL61805.1 hypothetical protein [bacterium]